MKRSCQTPYRLQRGSSDSWCSSARYGWARHSSTVKRLRGSNCSICLRRSIACTRTVVVVTRATTCQCQCMQLDRGLPVVNCAPPHAHAHRDRNATLSRHRSTQAADARLGCRTAESILRTERPGNAIHEWPLSPSCAPSQHTAEPHTQLAAHPSAGRFFDDDDSDLSHRQQTSSSMCCSWMDHNNVDRQTAQPKLAGKSQWPTHPSTHNARALTHQARQLLL